MLHGNHFPCVQVSRTVLDAEAFESLARQLHEALSVGIDHVIIDLTGVRWVYPAGAIKLVMLCRFLATRKACTPVIKFAPGAAYNYLESRGALELLRQTANLVDVPHSEKRFMHRNRALTEQDIAARVMQVSDESAIGALLGRVDTYLQKRDGLFYRKADALDVWIVLSEILHNVLDHNPVNTFALFLMEIYQRPTESLVTLAIGDAGVGISASLKRNPRYAALATDTQAISTAIQFGSSEFEEPSRGNGLFFTLKMLTAKGAAGHLRSGRGQLRFSPRRPRRQMTDVAFLPGTILSVSLPSTYRQLTISEWRKASHERSLTDPRVSDTIHLSEIHEYL